MNFLDDYQGGYFKYHSLISVLLININNMRKRNFSLLLVLLMSTLLCKAQKSKITSITTTDIDSVYLRNIADSTLATGWYFIGEDTPTNFTKICPLDELGGMLFYDTYYVNPYPIVTASRLKQIWVEGENGLFATMGMRFDKVATAAMIEAVKKNKDRKIAFAMADTLYIVGEVMGPDANGTMCMSNFSIYMRMVYKRILNLLCKEAGIEFGKPDNASPDSYLDEDIRINSKTDSISYAYGLLIGITASNFPEVMLNCIEEKLIGKEAPSYINKKILLKAIMDKKRKQTVISDDEMYLLIEEAGKLGL